MSRAVEREGSTARHRGEARSRNPYKPGSNDHTWWSRGWQRAEAWHSRKRGRR